MKNRFAVFILPLLATLALGQAAPVQNAKPDAALEAVLTQMDKAAANFKSAQADFQWDQYEEVVKQTDVQTGKIYFRRTSGGVDAALHIESPGQKQIIFKEGMLRMYEPKIDQVTERETGKNKSDVEAFLNLGFGGRGHELLASYEVKLAGWETVDGVKTAKLELVAISPKVRNMFSKFVLWIDPELDISLKQQFFEPAGDYRLAHYFNLKMNAKLPDDAFRLKTTSHTKVVKPH